VGERADRRAASGAARQIAVAVMRGATHRPGWRVCAVRSVGLLFALSSA